MPVQARTPFGGEVAVAHVRWNRTRGIRPQQSQSDPARPVIPARAEAQGLAAMAGSGANDCRTFAWQYFREDRACGFQIWRQWLSAGESAIKWHDCQASGGCRGVGPSRML